MLSCEYARCGSAAVWGFDDEGQARFCDRHKADGMVNFLNSSALPPRDIEAGARQQQPRVGMVAGDAYGEVQYPETKAAFEDPTVRADFVKKVLTVVFLQILMTTGIVLMCRYVVPIREYIMENSWIFWLSWGLALALIIGMHCAGRLLYTSPWNGIFVLVFTLAMSFMLAVVTAYYESDTLAFALIITTAIVCFCFLCALSNIDITKATPILMIGIFILIIMSVVAIFVYSNTYAIVFGILGAVIFSVMLMANLQMVMGGKKHQIRPEDWVAAALLIYLDIINIFQYVLLASAAGGR